MKPTLYLIIGLPGSGKTTKAEEIVETYKKQNKKIQHFEEDMFLDKLDIKPENYRKAQKDAKKWCYMMCRKAMINGTDVIISNNNIIPIERLLYIKLCHKYDYQIEVITMTGKYESKHVKNKFKLKIMESKFVPYSQKEFNPYAGLKL